MPKKAIIIGAGPAGLTAAYELLKRTDIVPIILEKSTFIGGISRTINYKGNRMDIGGHRFFSKSDRVMTWWLNILPLQPVEKKEIALTYQNKSKIIGNDNEITSSNESNGSTKVMLIRRRLSRIYFLRKFFNYPVQLSIDTLRKLGVIRTIQILFSYLWAKIFPKHPEKSLEDFLTNRFGSKLYQLFFKDYTEKVWGVPCKEISAEWGAQRIKGVSIGMAIRHAARTVFSRKTANTDISQKDTETSLIEQFLYPALGPGQLWEEVARQVEQMGGKIIFNQEVKELETENRLIKGVVCKNIKSEEIIRYDGDYFFSTMPVKELIGGMNSNAPDEVKEVAAGLEYRDFITVGILLKKLSISSEIKQNGDGLPLKDTWIYIQEKDVKVGRLQLFNNWSPFMVSQHDTAWIGMEYFCNVGDPFWNLSDDMIKEVAIAELDKIGIGKAIDVLDSTVQRVEKTYPAYFGTYERFDLIRNFVNKFPNLFLIGRNGMHKYNNADHSMLTAMTAVDNICSGVEEKENIWAINTEQEYHEAKQDMPEKVEENPSLSGMSLPKALPSFQDFLLRDKKQKRLLLGIFTTLIIQFIVFKILFPYPNFMPDSYSYLEAAIWNNDINLWPVGYSKFLRIFSTFTRSDISLVLFQYLFLQGTIVYFLFTLFYFLKLSRLVFYLLLCLFVFNPVFLVLSNYVSADAIFIGLSMIWLVQLILMIYQPKPYLIYTHAAVLLLVFMTRYNSLYYPIIAAIVLFASKFQWRTKLIGIMLSFLLLGTFIWHSGNKYYGLIGYRQFSAFAGWQLASNALFAYSQVANDQEKPPARFEALHLVVKKHLDSLKTLKHRPDSTLGIYYLWHGPLNQYMVQKWRGDSSTFLKKWSSMAPLYADYGKYLVSRRPITFVKYYLWPNTINYYVPPAEFLSVYNMQGDSIGKIAQNWFGYKSSRVKSYSKSMSIFDNFPIIVALANLVFILGVIGYFLLGVHKRCKKLFSPIIVLILSIWLANLFFSVFASPIVLRYQLFPFIITLALGIILVENIIKNETNTTAQTSH